MATRTRTASVVSVRTFARTSTVPRTRTVLRATKRFTRGTPTWGPKGGEVSFSTGLKSREGYAFTFAPLY